jgi:hypothetical protein
VGKLKVKEEFSFSAGEHQAKKCMISQRIWQKKEEDYETVGKTAGSRLKKGT